MSSGAMIKPLGKITKSLGALPEPIDALVARVRGEFSGHDAKSAQSDSTPAAAPELDSEFYRNLWNQLKLGNLAKASDLVEEFAPTPDQLKIHAWQIERIYKRERLLDSLADHLWRRKNVTFQEISLVKLFMRAARDGDTYDTFGAGLRTWLASGEAPRALFAEDDYLPAPSELDERCVVDLWQAKYGSWAVAPSQSFFEMIGDLASSFYLTPSLENVLFDARQNRNWRLPEWRKRARAAGAIDHFIIDLRVLSRCAKLDPTATARIAAFNRSFQLEKLIDLSRTPALRKRLKSPRGVLLCTFHGGYFGFLRRFWSSEMKDTYVIGMRNAGPKKFDLESGRDVVAFRAIKALKQGETILIASDAGGIAPTAQNSSELRVLGASIRIADGSPMIAYESGCDTGWISFQRKGDAFVPRFEPGPRRADGETFAQFKDRWLAFYAAQIEQEFTGDPSNVTPRMRWSTPLRSTVEPRAPTT